MEHLQPDQTQNTSENGATKKDKDAIVVAPRSLDRFLAISSLLVHCSSFMDAKTASLLRAMCRATLFAAPKFRPVLHCYNHYKLLIAWPCAKCIGFDYFENFVCANRAGRLASAQEINVDNAACAWTYDGIPYQEDMLPMPHLIKLSIILLPKISASFYNAFVNIQVLSLSLSMTDPIGEDSTYKAPANRKVYVLDLTRYCCLRELTIEDYCIHYDLTILGLGDITTLESANLTLHGHDYSRLLENKPNLKTLTLGRNLRVLPIDHTHVPKLIEFNGWDGECAIPPLVRTLGLCLCRYASNPNSHVRIPAHVSDLAIETNVKFSLDLSHVMSTLVSLRVRKGCIHNFSTPTPMACLQVLHMSGTMHFRTFNHLPELRVLKLYECDVGLDSFDVSDDERAHCFVALKNLQTLSIRWHNPAQYNYLSMTPTIVLIGWDKALLSLAHLPNLEDVVIDSRLPYETAFCGSPSPSSSSPPLVHLTLLGVDEDANAISLFWSLRASSFTRVSHLTLQGICVTPTSLVNLGVGLLSLRHIQFDDPHDPDTSLILDSLDIRIQHGSDQDNDDWILSQMYKAVRTWDVPN